MGMINIDNSQVQWVSALVLVMQRILEQGTFTSNQVLYVGELIDQLKHQELSQSQVSPARFYRAMLQAWREGGRTLSDDICEFFPVLIRLIARRSPGMQKFLIEVSKFPGCETQISEHSHAH